MRIFVTGATGYVGYPLCRRLRAVGHEVVALVRAPGAERAQALERLGVELRAGDLSDVDVLLDTSVEAVIHAAFSLFPSSDRRTNVDGSLRLLRRARQLPLKRFVFTSSSLVYGPNDPRVAVGEDHPCKPHLRLARQQREVELALLEAVRAQDFPAVILRPSEIWGGDGGFFAGTIELLRRGHFGLARAAQRLSMVELDDLLDAIVRSLEAQLAPGAILNLSNPESVDAHQLYDALAAALRVARPPRVPLPLFYAAGALAEPCFALLGRTPPFNLEIARLAGFQAGPRSIDRARRELGFVPRHDNPLDAIVRHYARAERDQLGCAA